MTDDGLGGPGARGTAAPDEHARAGRRRRGLLGKSKTTLGNQLAVHHAATAALLSGSAAPTQAPPTDAAA
jgi:hypothetical protein